MDGLLKGISNNWEVRCCDIAWKHWKGGKCWLTSAMNSSENDSSYPLFNCLSEGLEFACFKSNLVEPL